MRGLYVFLVTLFLLPLAAAAQERANTILVLDGSGSMWGQIDGVNKIVIAREVVAEILADFPADQNLGLTVYGHRTRGDCTDIETVVEPGIDNRQTILDAVNAINPRGKTPMTDSIIAAAEALRFTEEAATVILVSDGIETCNPDPCAAARILEETGIDFTAHVVGFDVTEAEALAQMQCLADETGGQFLTASNADELSAALTQIATAPEPVPEPEPVVVTGTFTAILEGEGRTVIAEPILWTVSSDAGVLAEDMQANPLTLDLTEGTYRAVAYRIVDEEERESTFTVTGPSPVSIDIAFPDALPQASLTAPDTVPMGSQFQVGWEGPGENLDTIQIAPAGEFYFDFDYVRNGNPVTLVAPIAPGVYELSYRFGDALTIATRPITVTEAPLTLDAPDRVGVGAAIAVIWQGPDAPGDNIQIGVPGGSYTQYIYTRDGNPVVLTAPGTPGTYEVRYRFRDRFTVLTRPIEVTAVPLSLTAPETVGVGTEFQVSWEGPDAPRDNIQIGPIGGGYSDYSYTETGSPVTLTAPGESGTYELRYRFQDRETIFTTTIVVTDVQATLGAPESAPAGSTIPVTWEGPDERDDYISVSIPGDDGWVNYTYTRDGSPAQLLLPSEPGLYELHYTLREGRNVLASRSIEVTAVTATVSATTAADAGSTIAVTWTGPDYRDDYIAISVPGEEGYVNYAYTRNGTPADLLMPSDPGAYEIRYYMRQNRTLLATQQIEVGAVSATVSAPVSAPAGSTVSVTWTGPDERDDYIAISVPGEEGYINYAYTRDGTPAGLLMPSEPGSYEIRYYMRQDRTLLAAQQIEVTAVTATVSAPATAAVGSTVAVNWTGPDYRDDYIAISVPGEDGWLHYTYARDGTPAQLLMPTEPGEYEIRYIMRQDRVMLASQLITVSEVGATLTTPDSATAGETITVGWDGPGYDRDFISVAAIGEDGYVNYTYTRDGNPAQLLMPTEPGQFEIRYQLGQENEVLVTRPITISALKVELRAPAEALAGETILVAWDGPDYDRDFLAVGPIGGTDYVTYTYTREGNPTPLRMPSEPGDYEIRYTLDQGRDIVQRVPIMVLPVHAQIVAPPSVPLSAGTIIVGWDGPGYDRDFLAFAVPGEDSYGRYAYVREGNPSTIQLPDTPGTYELRYYLDQDRSVLASITIEVTAE